MTTVPYPKGEHVMTGYYNRKGELLFIVTKKKDSDWFYCYEFTGSAFRKLGKSKNPLDFYEKYHILERIRTLLSK